MPQNPISVTIASAATTSAWADLGSYHPTVFVQIPTMSTASSFQIQYSFDGGTTGYYMFHEPINSATVAQNLVNITITVGTNGGYFQIPGGGQNFRFVAAAAVNNGMFIKVIGYK